MMFKIYGSYEGNEYELLDSADTGEEAEQLLCEYVLAFGKGWLFRIEESEG